MKQFNSTLNRYTPLKAKAQERKVRKALPKQNKSKGQQRRQAARVRREYMAEHLRCMVCGISVFARPSRPLHCHHLMGRGNRHDRVENLGAICDRDHRHYHDGGEHGDDGQPLPKLTGGHLLWAKIQADGPIDEALLAGLRGWKALPADWEPRELPAAFMAERANNWR